MEIAGEQVEVELVTDEAGNTTVVNKSQKAKYGGVGPAAASSSGKSGKTYGMGRSGTKSKSSKGKGKAADRQSTRLKRVGTG